MEILLPTLRKSRLTYYSNGGIYLIKKSILKYIPKEVFYNSTDLMEELIKLNDNDHELF